MAHDSYDSFEAVKVRLDEIVDAVNDENLPLDEALSLYEEAVGLGLRASDLLEEHIEAHQVDDESDEDDRSKQEEESAQVESSSADAVVDATLSA